MAPEDREATLGVLGARQRSLIERVVGLTAALLLDRGGHTGEVSNLEVADLLGIDADEVGDALAAMSGEAAPFAMRMEAAE